jgi:hypothetical protein
MKAKTELPEWCLILKELEEEAKRESTAPPVRGKIEGGDHAPSEAERDFFVRGDA